MQEGACCTLSNYVTIPNPTNITFLTNGSRDPFLRFVAAHPRDNIHYAMHMRSVWSPYLTAMQDDRVKKD